MAQRKYLRRLVQIAVAALASSLISALVYLVILACLGPQAFRLSVGEANALAAVVAAVWSVSLAGTLALANKGRRHRSH